MPTRRRFCAAAAAVGAALAGCAGGPADDGRPTTEPGGADPDAVARSATPPGTADLDLSEANVVAVAVEGDPGGDVRFEVTLLHDDDGEDGYADWWQVEARDGTRLGRRELLHAHSTAPFTRSATVGVPADAGCVVVRGHDQLHGYGGRAMVVDVATGATRAVDQGPRPGTFADAACP